MDYNETEFQAQFDKHLQETLFKMTPEELKQKPPGPFADALKELFDRPAEQ